VTVVPFTAVTVPPTPVPPIDSPTLTPVVLATTIVKLLAENVADVVENVTDSGVVTLAVVFWLMVIVVPLTPVTVVFALIPLPVTNIPLVMPVELATVIVFLFLLNVAVVVVGAPPESPGFPPNATMYTWVPAVQV